jgi:hypothetical protein
MLEKFAAGILAVSLASGWASTPRDLAGFADGGATASDTGAVLRGVVVTQTDGSPVAAADVWLTSLDVHARTDSAGSFVATGLAPGVQLVQIRRLGYAVLRDTLTLVAGHETSRRFTLTMQANTLDTVRTVAAERKYISGRLRGFEERRLSKQGGYFVTDSALRKNEGSTLPNIVSSRVPGLKVVNLLRTQVLVSTRKLCRGLVFQNKCGANPDCFVSIYMDGVLYFTAQMAETGATPPDLSKLNVGDLAGAEFYADGASAPAGMHTNDDGCGTLWLWTREK